MIGKKAIPVYRSDYPQSIDDVIGYLYLDPEYEHCLAHSLQGGIKYQLSGTIVVNNNELQSIYFEPCPVKPEEVNNKTQKLAFTSKPNRTQRLAFTFLEEED